jgi:hypothetical protein
VCTTSNQSRIYKYEARLWAIWQGTSQSSGAQLEIDGRVFNQFEKGKVFKFLQYSEMECNCAKTITEGLFREYRAL